MKTRKKWTLKLTDIPVLLLAVLCICCLSLQVRRVLGTTVILAIWGLYYLLEGYDLLHCKLHENLMLVLVTVYVFLCLLYRYIGLSDENTGITSIFLSFLPYYAIIPIYKKLDRKQGMFIILVCLATVLVTMWQNYKIWSWNGVIPIHMYLEGYLEVINTQYSSAIMLLAGIMFCLFLHQKGFVRYISLGVALICILFNTLIMQRGIAFLLTMLMITLLLLYNTSRDRRIMTRYILLMCLIVFVLLFYRFVLGAIASISGSQRLASRLQSIITLFDASDISEAKGGSLTARLQLIGVSIKTFFESLPNFLFGVGDKVDNFQVGNHAQFFDEFARYGLLGGLLSNYLPFGMMKTAIRFVSLPKNSTLYRQIIVIFFIYMLRCLVGGIFAPSIGAVMFIMLPIAFGLLKTNERNSQEVYSR